MMRARLSLAGCYSPEVIPEGWHSSPQPVVLPVDENWRYLLYGDGEHLIPGPANLFRPAHRLLPPAGPPSPWSDGVTPSGPSNHLTAEFGAPPRNELTGPGMSVAFGLVDWACLALPITFIAATGLFTLLLVGAGRSMSAALLPGPALLLLCLYGLLTADQRTVVSASGVLVDDGVLFDRLRERESVAAAQIRAVELRHDWRGPWGVQPAEAVVIVYEGGERVVLRLWHGLAAGERGRAVQRDNAERVAADLWEVLGRPGPVRPPRRRSTGG